MSQLIITGASDDLVEVDGAMSLEYNTEDVLLLIVDGDRQAKVRVRYDGVWRIEYGPVAEDVPCITGTIGGEGYTARLVLEVERPTVNELASEVEA